MTTTQKKIKANKILKEIYLDKGITVCEMCGGSFALSWHHRHKRWWYIKKTELLSSFNQTILVCQNCHNKIEYDKELHNKTFERLRGDEI